MTSKQLAYNETEQQCAYCGIGEHLTVDHIHGRDCDHWKSYDNLIILCRSCHDRKDHTREISVDEIMRLKRGLIYETLGDARMLLVECIVQGKLKRKRSEVVILLELRLIRDTGEIRSSKRAYIPTKEGRRFHDMWL